MKLSQTQLDAFDRDGYLFFPSLFKPDEIKRLADEVPAIYAASGNDFIAESAERHWRHIRRAMGAVLRTPGTRASVWDEHEAILHAVARGDAARAERLARAHGEEAGRSLAARLDHAAGVTAENAVEPAPRKAAKNL